MRHSFPCFLHSLHRAFVFQISARRTLYLSREFLNTTQKGYIHLVTFGLTSDFNLVSKSESLNAPLSSSIDPSKEGAPLLTALRVELGANASKNSSLILLSSP